MVRHLRTLRHTVKTDHQLVLVLANLVTSLIAAVSSYLAHHKLRIHLGSATVDFIPDADASSRPAEAESLQASCSAT
jgi:hypothetical protein